MIEVKLGWRTVDLPYTVRIRNVSEELFDEWVDEDTKAELINGVMVVHSPATLRHDDVSGFLRSLMRSYVEETEQGKVLGPDSIIHLATCRKFAPDGFFLDEEMANEPTPEKQFEGAPALVYEVLSPSNRDDDLEKKRPAYQEAGVVEIWFVDLEAEQVIVDRRVKRRYTTHTVNTGRVISRVLKGFWIEVDWLWSDPMPKVQTCLRKLLRAR